MDGSRFDALSRTLVAGHSRRGLAHLLGGLGLLELFGQPVTLAKRKHKKHKKKHKRPPPSTCIPDCNGRVCGDDGCGS